MKSSGVHVSTQRGRQGRGVLLHDIEDNVAIHTEILMDENVAETADLRPRDLRVYPSDLVGEMIHSFPDDLQVALDGVLGHLRIGRVNTKGFGISGTAVDRLEHIVNALRRVAPHSSTASTSADAEIGRLSS